MTTVVQQVEQEVAAITAHVALCEKRNEALRAVYSFIYSLPSDKWEEGMRLVNAALDSFEAVGVNAEKLLATYGNETYLQAMHIMYPSK